MTDETEAVARTARKYALQNAVSFEGSAQLKAVIGKVIGRFKKKLHPKEIIPMVKSVVADVNQLSIEEQRAELERIAPELLEKKKQKRDYSLPDLPQAEMGEVITRFPPEPNGYLHIGHAKAAIVDFEYAQKYDGTFILRFDDTNPIKDELLYYDEQKKDLKWLGINWDKVYHTSDHLPRHYELAVQLIQQGDAYVCTCSSDRIRQGRQQRRSCACQEKSPDQQMELWEQMHEQTCNGVLRLHAEMKSDNTAMRDPTLFRIINEDHPLQKDRFHIWPTYDFAGAVEDSISGVTHPFRTKEYELRDEVYFFLLEKLGLRKPVLMEFARLNIEGMPVSKRKITPLVEDGWVMGFDDVRLPTLRGLARRGIVPAALKQFVFQQGISKVESTVPFSLVEAENRKIIDPVAKRFFFVPQPVKLVVKNASNQKVCIPFHPVDKTMGNRTVHTTNTFYISQSDVDQLREGAVFRLKDLYNIRVDQIQSEMILGSYAGKDLIADSLKIQWTPDHNVPVTVFIPDLLYKNDEFNVKSLQKISGVGEPAINQIDSGEIVQFERFGFVRIEKQNDNIIGFFTHK